MRRLTVRLDDSTSDYAKLVHKFLARFAYTNSVQCLVPNIEVLELHYHESNFLNTLIFLGPRLERLTIKNLNTPASLYNTVTTLLSRAPSISKLSLQCNLTIDTMPFDNDFALACGTLSGLEELTLYDYQLTPNALLSLSSLPQLQYFGYKSSKKITYGKLNESFSCKFKKLCSPYPRLRKVTFNSHYSALTFFLSMEILVPTIEHLTLDIRGKVVDGDMMEICKKIGQYWRNISYLHIKANNVEDSQTQFFATYLPLSNLQKMRKFMFVHLKALIITDEEVRILTQCWPQLSSFVLFSHFGEFYLTESKLTLSALAYFANNCPNIEELILRVDGKKKFKILPETPVMKELKLLCFCCSPILEPEAVAFELSKVLDPTTRHDTGFSQIKEEITDELKKEILQACYEDWMRVLKSLKLIAEVEKRQLGLPSEGIWST